MSPSDRPKRNPIHAYRAVGDEGGLVVAPEEHKVQVLNPVGSRIYALLDGKHSRDEIVSAIVAEFDVAEAEARRDLDAYLEQLRANSMLDAVEKPGEDV